MSEKTVPDVKFMLANRSGALAFFSPIPQSRYEGFFVRRNGKLIKTIESLKLDVPVTGVVNELWRVIQTRDKLTEYFFLPLNEEALIYELSERKEIELCVDIKTAEDNRIWGRQYDSSPEDGALVIRFRKELDPRDDNSVHATEFEGYLAIAGDNLESLPLHHWEEHQYAWDAARHSPPQARWVFKPAKIRSTGFAIAYDDNKQTAITRAKNAWENREHLKKEREAHAGKLVAPVPKHAPPTVSLAYQCAKNALDSLILDEHCLTAGMPWFYQCWTRDQLISINALARIGHLDICRKIFTRLIDQIQPDGLLPNIEQHGTLPAADATGWLFFRLHEWLTPLLRNGLLDKYISRRERDHMITALSTTLDTLWRTRVTDNVMHVGPKESWMDTEWGTDSRQGALIEINALLLSLFRALRQLTNQHDPREPAVRKAVIKHFWTGHYLSDTADSQTIRPNAFIAAYIHPSLLSKQQWTSCFEHLLPRLWLSWGGLASIDKKSELYTDTYTGEDNKSYHRGDSWYWINNLAATVMHRTDPEKFKKHIDKILDASTTEILYKGATGHHAELSSAKQLEGNGCLSQAWSAAMYIELVEEVYGKPR
ncbi:hypothetical protein HY490_05480 [Candidatus Woesearchaeota archaeon]|nr:hypothetical protein [Candidatus Woesearchaeota archaeon]